MALIVWKDYVKDSTLTDSSYGTDLINSIDANNVKTRQVGDVARWQFGSESPDTQAVRLRFDFGAAKNINFLAVMAHSGATTNTVEIDLGTSAGASDVYNGGATTMWTPGSNDASNYFEALGATYSARYAQVTLAALSNEVIDIGRIWIGESWAANFSMDFSMAVVDRSTKSKSRGGSTWNSDRQKLKQITCRCYGLSDANFIGTSADFDSFLDMDLTVGNTGEIIVIPRNDDEHERHRLGVYGTIVQNGPVRVTNRTSSGLFTEKTFTVEEDR